MEQQKESTKILQKGLKNFTVITPEVFNTLLQIETNKGFNFNNEFEIASHLNKTYEVNITEDFIADIFALEREEEDKYLIYKNYLGS